MLTRSKSYGAVIERSGRSGAEGPEEGVDAGGGHRHVLLAVTAAHPDAAHHLPLDLDGESAHEDGKAARVHGVDAEGLVAGQGGAAGDLVEAVGRAAMAGRGEGLGDGDLDPGDPRPRHPVETKGMAAIVADADGLGDADLAGLVLGRLHDHLGVLKGQPSDRDHGTSTHTSPASTRTGKVDTLAPRPGKVHRPVRTSYIQPCQGQVSRAPLSLPSLRGAPRWAHTSRHAYTAFPTRARATAVPRSSTRRGRSAGMASNDPARTSLTGAGAAARSHVLLEHVSAVQPGHVEPPHVGGLAHRLQGLGL